ncbi:hypothetical protein HNY73_012357 [Argiope bruennichi]|uniref:Uncharacterized protein n=1 Tax=Argiope bruennichi TaxID=94029 RepID=A0A8T0F0C1_ARGBR|nr:hypothetical protein HNY73_012357 [Argiope bruennichi]
MPTRMVCLVSGFWFPRGGSRGWVGLVQVLYRDCPVGGLQRTISIVYRIGCGVSISSDTNFHFSDKFYKSIDGAPLCSSRLVPRQSDSIQFNNRFLSGRDFIDLLKIRIKCLPTASRCAQGRPDKDNPPQKSIFDTPSGNRKPDTVAIKDNKIRVIDTQAGDAADLAGAQRRKVTYYGESDRLVREITSFYNIDEIYFSSLTLNFRGVRGLPSKTELVDRCKMLSNNEIPILSTRTLLGTFSAYTSSNLSTSHSGGGPM